MNSDTLPDSAPDTSASDLPVAPPQDPGLSQKQKAWLGMAAVGVALVLLTLMPGPESIDPKRPRRLPTRTAPSRMTPRSPASPRHSTLR